MLGVDTVTPVGVAVVAEPVDGAGTDAVGAEAADAEPEVEAVGPAAAVALAASVACLVLFNGLPGVLALALD